MHYLPYHQVNTSFKISEPAQPPSFASVLACNCTLLCIAYLLCSLPSLHGVLVQDAFACYSCRSCLAYLLTQCSVVALLLQASTKGSRRDIQRHKYVRKRTQVTTQARAADYDRRWANLFVLVPQSPSCISAFLSIFYISYMSVSSQNFKTDLITS